MAENSKQAPAYRLSTQDATFIYGESRNGPLHIGSMGLFQGQIDFIAMLGHFEERIHLVPRYRQRLVEVPFNVAHAMMEDDPEFSFDNHVFRHELEDGLSETDAIAEMMEIYQTPLSRAHPLWELHSFENLEGDRTGTTEFAVVIDEGHALPESSGSSRPGYSRRAATDHNQVVIFFVHLDPL